MSTAYHCDGADCETWQRADSDLHDNWHHVHSTAETVRSFCSADCLLAYYNGVEGTIHG